MSVEPPLLQQVRLIRPYVLLRELVRWPAKVPSESRQRSEVVLPSGRGVVAPLEFVQHHLTKTGHKTPPVTPTLPGRSSEPYA